VTSPRSPADAARIAEAVGHLPEVARLSGGSAGTVATYLPGDRVLGVRVRADGVEVHVVVASLVTPLPVVADRVRAAVRERVPGAFDIDVFIDDVDPGLPTPLGLDAGSSPTTRPAIDDTSERSVRGGPERQPSLLVESAPTTRSDAALEDAP
jgi:hypothetical protein